MAQEKKTAEVVEENAVQSEQTENTATTATESSVTEDASKDSKPKKKTATKKAASAASKKTAAKKAKATSEKPEEFKDETNIENAEEVSAEVESPKASSAKTASSKLGVADKRKNKEHILTIGDERSVKTNVDLYNEAAIDIRESLQNGKILTDTIDGIEVYDVPDVGKTTVAVVNHGDIKVCIRLEDAVLPPRRVRGVADSEAHQFMLTKRLGAEIDYVIVGIDNTENIAVGNRLQAMKAKRKQFYFKEDRDGNKQLYPDKKAEARVVAVIQKGIFVEIFGAETFIPREELSYQRMVNAEEHFAVGERVLVRVQSIEYDKENFDVYVKASVKRVEENPAIKAINSLQLKQRYVGTVTQVDVDGVFVKLNCGVDVKCKFPTRGRPVRGSKATVAITWIDKNNCRVWGNIISSSAVL